MRFDLRNLLVVKVTSQEGVSQKTGNPWKKLNLTLKEEFNGYQSMMVADLFGMDDCNRFMEQVREGDRIDASFKIDSQEWQGKRYNNISVLSFQKTGNLQQMTPRGQQMPPSMGDMPSSSLDPNNYDDLPAGF